MGLTWRYGTLTATTLCARTARRGGVAGRQAIVGTACKIARIVYHMLKGRREYIDYGTDYYEHKYQEQVLKKL